MQKDFNGSEKREYQRHVFTSDDEVVGFFESPKISADLLSYNIADISAVGLKFFISRNEKHPVEIGDTFILKKIMGKMKLAFITEIDLKVQWVVDHDLFGHIAVGCQFINVSKADQTRIDRFVQYEAIGKSME